MTEYSRAAKGSFTQAATGNAVPIALPFQPTLVRLTNLTAYQNAADSDIPWAIWTSNMAQGTAAVGYNDASTGVLETAYVASGGISTFSGGLLEQFGPTLNIEAITLSSTIPQVQTTTPHGLQTGDVVTFQNLYQSSSTGQIQIAGIPFVITYVDATHFTIQYNNNVTGYTALSGSPTSPTPTVKQILYPNLYAPSLGFIWKLTLGTTTTVYTTAPSNVQVGQQVAFRIPAAWGTTQLNSLPNATTPGQPVYGYVTSIVNATEFVVNINSTGYTAFTTSIAFAAALAGGLNFAQVLAVGDVNSGGTPYSGGALYPSPSFYNGTANAPVNSINGPAILGAFCNNTAQGFVIGAGNAVFQGGSADASSHLSGETSDFIIWEAYYLDIN